MKAAKPIRLGRVQTEIMDILWERGEATAREITDALSAKSTIAHSTVQTLLRELESKHAVAHEQRDRTFVFKPIVRRQEVAETTTRELVSKLFKGSAYGLVSHLLKHEEISDDELKRLKELIESRSKENRG